MPLFVTVTPGTTVTNSTTLDATVLNLLGTPSVDVTGTVDGGSLSISPGSVGTTQLADNAVTFAKLDNIDSDRLIGRDSAGSGDPEQITVGGGLQFTGSGGVEIAARGVTEAKLFEVTTKKLLGRNATTNGDVQQITVGSGLSLSDGGVLSNTATAKYYKSPSAIFLPTLAGAITPQEHSLSSIPNLYTVQFIYSNATASAAGYVNGDVVESSSFYGQNYAAVCSLFSDATYLYLRMNLNFFGVTHKTTGSITDITSELTSGTRWKFKLNAVAFP